MKVSMVCGPKCLKKIDYCIQFIYEEYYDYDDSDKQYVLRRVTNRYNQTGRESSNTFLEIFMDYTPSLVESYYLDGIRCVNLEHEGGQCLECQDGRKYCADDGVPAPSYNPYFAFGEEVKSLSLCPVKPTTTSELEIKTLLYTLEEPPHLRALFSNHHGA